MLRLRVKPPGGEPYSVPLELLPLKIGRSARSDLRLEDPFASRLHAELRAEGQGLRLTDLGSGNGTYINGHRIGSDAELKPGDRVQIGNTVLHVEGPGEGGAGTREEEGEDGDLIIRPVTTHRAPAAVRQTRLAPVVEAVREAATTTRRPRAVEHRNELFTVISKVGAALLSPAELQEVLNQILDLLFEAVEAERAYLLLREGESGRLVCKLASFRRSGARAAERDARISRSIVDRVVGRGEPVLTSDALEDERFRHRESIVQASVRSAMAAPLAIEDRILGMIYVDSPVAANIFAEDDLQMLTTIACVAAIKVENAVLLEQRLEHERIRQQLASARRIQARLLPRVAPSTPGYEIAGTSFPCGEVGGDYFDYLERPGGRLLIALGDVCGKGLDAALLMSSLHASMRAESGAGASSTELMARVNRYVVANSPSNRFVTLFSAELDPARHHLEYVNAGHNPPLLVRAGGEVEELKEGGLPVGVRQAVSYRRGEVALEPGDVLLIYSDGITEATDREGREFTAARLVEVVRRFPGALASELQELIDQELGEFMGTAPRLDDMTLIVVRRGAA